MKPRHCFKTDGAKFYGRHAIDEVGLYANYCAPLMRGLLEWANMKQANSIISPNGQQTITTSVRYAF